MSFKMARESALPEPQDETEAKAILLAIAGSEEAFGFLVRRYQRRVRSLLFRACGDAALADDLGQTTFVKAWRNIGALRDASRFLPWLRRIALNTAVDAARAGLITTEPLCEDFVPAVDVANNASDRRLDIDAALRRLSFAQRACVLAAYGEGMSHAEMAVALNMPVGTVKSHLARGLSVLRGSLKDWRADHD